MLKRRVKRIIVRSKELNVRVILPESVQKAFQGLEDFFL